MSSPQSPVKPLQLGVALSPFLRHNSDHSDEDLQSDPESERIHGQTRSGNRNGGRLSNKHPRETSQEDLNTVLIQESDQEDVEQHRHRKRRRKLEPVISDISEQDQTAGDLVVSPARLSFRERSGYSSDTSTSEGLEERRSENRDPDEVSDSESELDLDLYLSGLDGIGMASSTYWEQEFLMSQSLMIGHQSTQDWPQLRKTPATKDDQPIPWHPFDPGGTQFELSKELPLRSYRHEEYLDPYVLERHTQDAVCFGVIHDVRVKVLPHALEPLKLISSTQNNSEIFNQRDIYSFDIFREDDGTGVLIQVPKSMDKERSSISNVAVLNQDASKIISELAAFCTFEAYSSRQLWTSIIDQTTKIEKKTYVLIDVILYGQPEHFQEIGEYLTSKKVYLQEPDYWQPGLRYKNPHFLDLSDVAKAVDSTLDLSTISFLQQETGLQLEPPEEFTPNRGILKQKIAAAFQNTTRAKNLNRIEADSRITTPLKFYQEEALDFIRERESGPVQPEYCLWRPNCSNNNTSYTHTVTGCKRHEKPTEIGGGILADDMGLGKTLTMLAAIIRTVDEAKAFADLVFDTGQSSTGVKPIHSRGTLAVVPTPLLIHEWTQEIKLHCTGFANIVIYHGQGREGDARALADSDIVLSTYHTISHEAKDPTSPLWKIKWFRIILDEAHIIRRMSTKLFGAMKTLHGCFRWCLTGTPVHNSLEDLAALVSFIRSSPLDDLHRFRKYIISPLIRRSENGEENLRMLLDSICLRRTKQLLNLPEVTFETRFLSFSTKEEQQYINTREKMIRKMKQKPLHPKTMKGHLGVFQLLLQLRRLCNHGTFQKLSLDAEEFDPKQAIEVLKKEKEAKCQVCRAKITSTCGLGTPGKTTGSFTTCGHLLCLKCLPKMKLALQKIEGRDGYYNCSLCSEAILGEYVVIDDAFAQQPRIGSKRLSPWQYFDSSGCSTKMSALVSDVENNETDGKSIVFSCWTRSLDLVEIFLKSRKVPFLRIDGSYSQGRRNEVLRTYHKDPEIKILLMTTGTGAFGLNLTVANCVYLLEPQWNPMVESQAIGRVLRLGQERNVRVVRYIMKGTLEEVEIQSQQERKIEYSKVGWNEDVCEKTAICT